MGKLRSIGIVLTVIALFAVGIILPGKRLPKISLAAEEIPLPINIPLFGQSIPNTLPATWLTMAILLGIGWAYNKAQRKEGRLSLFQVAVETVIEEMLKWVEGIGGKHTRVFFPMVATFFFFIAISNWGGLLPGFGSIGVWVEHHGETEFVPFLRTANAHLSTTLALAIVSVGSVNYYGYKVLGKSYFKRYFDVKINTAFGVLGLLELILEFIKVIPFAFRLFGNILAGEVLLFIVSYLFSFIFPIVFMGLELFVGAIQALIFAMLTLVFFSTAVSHQGEESEPH
ncbi:MAG: F0F1 ATP synthase subunit A [Anaerolineales bacterium]